MPKSFCFQTSASPKKRHHHSYILSVLDGAAVAGRRGDIGGQGLARLGVHANPPDSGAQWGELHPLPQDLDDGRFQQYRHRPKLAATRLDVAEKVYNFHLELLRRFGVNAANLLRDKKKTTQRDATSCLRASVSRLVVCGEKLPDVAQRVLTLRDVAETNFHRTTTTSFITRRME